MNTRRKLLSPFGMWIVFEIVAVTLWLTKDNLFYLLNFSYIGTSIAVGILLFQFNYKYARRIVQLLVGLYMLIYLGLICQENMQIEGFWYYLFTGVFEAATIHYAVAKILGPLLFGRGWCGYACWTAMVLDFLPYKKPQAAKKKDRLYPVYHIFIFAFFRGDAFSELRRKYGKNHVYSFYCGEYSVLYCGDHSGIPIQR